MFHSQWWSLPINPYFLPRKFLWNAIASIAPMVHGRLLDVGCGNKPYQILFTHVSSYVGLELDTPNNRQTKPAEIFYDGIEFPLSDASFDTILCNQVLEHVFSQKDFVAELLRVLRPGGTLILTVPFLWPEHEQPNDCLRYTSFGLRNLLEQRGFCVERQEKLTRSGGAICALWSDRLNTLLRRTPLLFRIFGRAFLISPISLLGWLLALVAADDSELYLDNFVICRKPEA